jgi:ABC-type sugar transport system ATPase subunit
MILVPEDRKLQGLFLNRTVKSNITVTELLRSLTRGFCVNRRYQKDRAEELAARLDVKCRGISQSAGQLSGGNQQKVLFARGLSVSPDVLILDEPTRGIDVGAKSEIHQLMDELARQGMAILMISSDLPEVLGMGDRIIVMRQGRAVALFSHDEATSEKIMWAAAGGDAS